MEENGLKPGGTTWTAFFRFPLKNILQLFSVACPNEQTRSGQKT
jgi:hypothetical protein